MRKIISTLLALLIVFNINVNIPENTVYAEQSQNQITYSSQEIHSYTDFDVIRANPDGNYILMEDIILSAAFEPIPEFSGILEGNGHTISGLSITADVDNPRVSFIINNSGTIRNLGFDNVQVIGISTSSSCWASIITSWNSGTIENCYVKGSVSGGYRSAGIAVRNTGVIKNCYSIADVSAKAESGGIVAVMEGGANLRYSYSIGDISSDDYNTGGIVAYAYSNATIRNCVFIGGTVSNGNHQNSGRIVGRINGTPTLNNNYSLSSILVDNSVVTGTITDKNGADISSDDIEKRYTYDILLGWDFNAIWSFDGAKDRPVLRDVLERNTNVYYINQSTINLINTYGSSPDNYLILTEDINLSALNSPFTDLYATFDGNGYYISGLNLQASSINNRISLFRNNYGHIKNVGLSINLTGLDTDSTYWAAGIAGSNYGTIESCYTEGNISGAYRVGGIALDNWNSVENCFSNSSLSAKVECGGIVSVTETHSIVDKCYFAGSVYSVQRNTGGIAAYGYTDSVIKNSAVLDLSISNGFHENIGRITGRLNGTPVFENNIANGAILIDGVAVTGSSNDNNGMSLYGADLLKQYPFDITLSWDFEKCWAFDTTCARPVLRKAAVTYNETEIDSVEDLDYLRSTTENARTHFILTQDLDMTNISFEPIDDFYGTFDGNGHVIKNLTIVSDNTEELTAFIRNNYGVISNLGLAGIAVHGSSNTMEEWAAGLVGINEGVIEQCYVNGNISGGYRSGGLVAYNRNVIQDCYVIATVTGYGESGGLVAVSEPQSIISNCYVRPIVYAYDKKTAGGIVAYAYGDSVIRNSISLSGYVKDGDCTGEDNNVNRIVGKQNGTPIYINNYASENVVIRNEVEGTAGAVNNKKGLTVTTEELTDELLFYYRLGWSTDKWSYLYGENRPAIFDLNDLTLNRVITSVIADTTTTVSTGITYRSLSYYDMNWNRQNVFIIDADMSAGNYEMIVGIKNDAQPDTDVNGNYIRYTYLDESGEEHDLIKGIVPEQMSTTASVRGVDVYAGVNGEFYTEEGPEGYMIKDGVKIINGTRISTPNGKQYPFHGFLGATYSGSFVIGTYDDDWSTYVSSLKQATGGQFIVVKNGEIPYYGDQIECLSTETDYDEQTFYRINSRHPRTVAGYYGTHLVLVVIDGRQKNGATGMHIEELGPLMKYLGCTDAINMDGGGSSTAVVNNNNHYSVLNYPATKPAKSILYDGLYLRSVFSSVLIVEKQVDPS